MSQEPGYRDGEEYYSSFANRFTQPPNMTRSGAGKILIGVEVGFLVYYMLDLALKATALGAGNFFHFADFSGGSRVIAKGERWDLVRILLWLGLFFDVILAMVGVRYRYFRMFRPLYLISYVRELRRWVFLTVMIVPVVIQLFMLIGIVVLLYSVLGVLLFHGAPEYTDPYQNFDNVGYAALSLYVLYTTENYPDIMAPAYARAPMASHAYALFFVSFLILGMFCLANLIVPVMYQAFREHRNQLALTLHIYERRALLAAFQLLDNQSNGTMDYDTFAALVARLRPETAGKAHIARLMMKELQQGRPQGQAGMGGPEIAGVGQGVAGGGMDDALGRAGRYIPTMDGIHETGGSSFMDDDASTIHASLKSLATTSNVSSARSVHHATPPTAPESGAKGGSRLHSARSTSRMQALNAGYKPPTSSTALASKARRNSRMARVQRMQSQQQPGLSATDVNQPDDDEVDPASACSDPPVAPAKKGGDAGSAESDGSTPAGGARTARLGDRGYESGGSGRFGMDGSNRSLWEHSSNAESSTEGGVSMGMEMVHMQNPLVRARMQQEMSVVNQNRALDRAEARKQAARASRRDLNKHSDTAFAHSTGFVDSISFHETGSRSQVFSGTEDSNGSDTEAEAEDQVRTVDLHAPVGSTAVGEATRRPSMGGGVGFASTIRGDLVGAMDQDMGDQTAVLASHEVLSVYEWFGICDVINRTYRKYDKAEIRGALPRHKWLEHGFIRIMAMVLPGITCLVIAAYPWFYDVVTLFCTVSLGLAVLENLMHLIVLRPKLYFHSKRQMVDLTLVGLAIMAFSIRYIPGVEDVQHLPELWLMLLNFRVVRVFAFTPKFRRMVMTVLSIARFMFVAALVMILLMYSFAIVGVDIFGGQFAKIDPYGRLSGALTAQSDLSIMAASVDHLRGSVTAMRSLQTSGLLSPTHLGCVESAIAVALTAVVSGQQALVSDMWVASTVQNATATCALDASAFAGSAVSSLDLDSLLGSIAATTLSSAENDEPDYVSKLITFDDFAQAGLQLFQIVTTSNWHNIMYTGTSLHASHLYILRTPAAAPAPPHLVRALLVPRPRHHPPQPCMRRTTRGRRRTSWYFTSWPLFSC